MANIPRSVLSEHLQERMSGRKLLTAVFLTFEFDPAFFEQEVLPVFLDVPLSHAKDVRLAQLEDALHAVPGHLAVYYDPNGLRTDTSGARLDVRRIPVRYPTGIFHPKNIFLLTEPVEADDTGSRPRSLLVATLSANLTESGWWSNVEVCHVEELEEGQRTRLREGLLELFETLRKRTPHEADHLALEEVRRFVLRTEQRPQRSTDGEVHPHFFSGKGSVVDFLDDVAGRDLRGMNLEVISPYFDDAPTSPPLEALLARFSPPETRVYLPRESDGSIPCREELHAWLRGLPGVSWGTLPVELLRLGAQTEARHRRVHAKVYRFFTSRPKREFLFIGSVNLTRPAHENGGNLETGIFVEVTPPRAPDFWMEPDGQKAPRFTPARQEGEAVSQAGARLLLRYHWRAKRMEAFWDDKNPSPALTIDANGEVLFQVEALPSRAWQVLTSADPSRLAVILENTSLLGVTGDRPGRVLVLLQEDGMEDKPDLFRKLSASDILNSWALLTPEQRAAFVETRLSELVLEGEGTALVSRFKALSSDGTLFGKLAGVFHAFGCLERTVSEALAGGNTKVASARLFGRKYDSLENLLERVLSEAEGDPVDRYLVFLCARQLCDMVRSRHAEYWKSQAPRSGEIEAVLERARLIREQLVASDPMNMPAFLEWFDVRFLKRASQAGGVQ
jgi:hypothetical protein